MILVCHCGCHFRPQTRHMRYRKGDLVRCPHQNIVTGYTCLNQVPITLNQVPEQDGEIIVEGFK